MTKNNFILINTENQKLQIYILFLLKIREDEVKNWQKILTRKKVKTDFKTINFTLKWKVFGINSSIWN